MLLTDRLLSKKHFEVAWVTILEFVTEIMHRTEITLRAKVPPVQMEDSALICGSLVF